MKQLLQNVDWTKVAFYFGATLILWVIIWLLTDTLVVFINEEAVANYLKDKTPIRFVVPAFQNVIIGLLWQPIAAVIAVIALSKPLGKLYDQIVNVESPPDFLRRVDEKTPNGIIQRRYPIIGRERELQILRAFAADKRLFVWTWMIGDGMQGKTRLAVEACLNLTRGDWDRSWRSSNVGFLGPGQDVNYWKTWQPYRPTFIVVDDAASRSSDVEPILMGLAQRAHNLKAVVRVLLVDRQMPEGLAKLETNQLLQSYAFQTNKRIVVLDFEGEERQKFFNEIQKSSLGSDLASFAAGIYNIQTDIKGFTAVETMLPFLTGELIFHDQLAVSIARDRLTRWKNLGIDDAALILVAVATLVNGLDWSYADKIVKDKPSNVVSEIEKVTFQRAADRIQPLGFGTIDLAIALLVLSEWPLPKRQEIASMAWQFSPTSLLRHIQNCNASGLPAELFGYFISPPPEDSTQAPEWALLVCLLLQMGTGPEIDWQALGDRLPETIQQRSNANLVLTGLLASGDYLHYHGDALAGSEVWPYLEGAYEATSRWQENKSINQASAKVLKEGLHLLATLEPNNESDLFAERLETLTEISLDEIQRKIAEPESFNSQYYRMCVLLRAESLSSLVEYFVARAEEQPVLNYLEELSLIKETLPLSREIAEAQRAVLEITCDSQSLVIEEERLSRIKNELSDVSTMLTDNIKPWEYIMDICRWIAESLSNNWTRQSE